MSKIYFILNILFFPVVGVITNNSKIKDILLLVKTPTAGGFFYIQILLFVLIIFTNVSSAQMKLHDNYAGLSVSSEIDNKVMSFNLNYEHELIKAGPNLIGVGASVKHLNWGSSISGNIFVSGLVNYNFSNLGSRKVVPFVGVMFGTNINYKVKYFIGQVGLRYFTGKNLSMMMKYGIGNRSYVVAEVGMEYRF